MFDSVQADAAVPEIAAWLASVNQRIGLGPLSPEPYWGLEDLRYAIGAKIKNCFYVVADSKTENNHEHFRYEHLLILSGFSFDAFLKQIENGTVFVDFDARSGHNHGTKFRIKQDHWQGLYASVEKVM